MGFLKMGIEDASDIAQHVGLFVIGSTADPSSLTLGIAELPPPANS